MTVSANRTYLRAAAVTNLAAAVLLLILTLFCWPFAFVPFLAALPCLISGSMYLRAARAAQPALTIDAVGVVDNTDCIPGGLLRWEDIKGVREGRYDGGQALFIDLHDPDAYLQRFSAGERVLLRSNVRRCGTPAVFSQRCVTTPIGDIRTAIETQMHLREARPNGQSVTARAAAATGRHWWTAVTPEERTVTQPLRLGRGGDVG